MRCFLQTIWYTLNHWINGVNALIEGHSYKNSEVFLDRVVLIDKCEDCGKLSISHCDRLVFETMKAEGKI